jgi:hypothetical protein
MKQDNNNEIDLLLRSLARDGRGESPLDVGNVARRYDEALSDHLDADELNSFAEGVVPARARARYVAHLADCGSCRATVTNLMRAGGVVAGSENFEHQTEASFWQRLASLFTLPILRYAVPALALTAIIGISFIAWRQDRRPDLVAQNEKTDSAAPVSTNQQQAASSGAQSNIQPRTNSPSATEPRSRLDSSADKKTTQGEKTGDDRPPAKATDLDAPTVSSLKDSPPSKQGSIAGVSRPVFAPEPEAPPPPPKPARPGADKTDAVQKEEVTRREVQALSREEAKNQPRDDDGRHGPSRSNAALSASRRADAGLTTESSEARNKSKKGSEDEVETRTVSGKHFRREGSAWIDTAYDSSRKTINVARGTEQFRALIADEPTIRTIAEKLNGVVIVVWNGRAYRIQ